jgi:hypothetical protein
VVAFINKIEAAALYLEVIESILSFNSLLMTLIMSFACDELVFRLATVRSGPDRGLFWRPFKKTGPYGPAPPDCSSVPKILDQTVQSGLFIT